MQIISENPTNYLVLREDGRTVSKTKSSDLNKLLFGYNLFELLQEGSEVWTAEGTEDEPHVTVIPDDNAECYTLRIGDNPDLTLGKHHKTDLVDALADFYDEHDEETVAPLMTLYDTIRENMVRQEVLDPFLDVFTEKVAARDNGWFINGHLLLTYEGEFYHSEHVSRNRSGSVIGEGLSKEAYRFDVESPSVDMDRNIEINGEQFRLTTSEMEFLGKAVWAIKNAPDRRDS